MNCISAIATIKGGLTASSSIVNKLTVSASIANKLTTSANIVQNKLKTTSSILTKISSKANLLNGGVNSSVCPIIFCIDGGEASTVSFPSVNGLLNGGTA